MVTVLRGRLAWIACAWLCCQLSLLAAAPLSLLAHATAAADSITCTCIHTGTAECPMHHRKPQQRGCECRNTTDPDSANVVTLLGPTAVLVDAPPRLMPPPTTPSTTSPTARFIGFVAPPDGPPPRA